MKFLFYLSGFLCLYSYFIYPLILRMTPARQAGRPLQGDGNDLPEVSLIVTVYNEMTRLADKLENSLQIDYPASLLEIIVASDCSTDDTDNIALSYADRGVKLVRADARKGKEYAQYCAIQQAKGRIFVFSDVATQIPPDALTVLVQQFQDPQVGAVSSEDRFISQDGRVAGEGAYVKYEMWLRRLESERAGLVGLSGSFFAGRREVCEEWDIFSPSDFNTALNCAKKGLVAVSCKDVVGVYSDVKDPELEYQRKIRTVIRGVTAIVRHKEVLNPLRMGFFSFQVWSHKIMRWAVPWAMLVFFITTLALQGQGWIFSLALALQLAFYALAILGWASKKARENTLVKIVFFFVQTNLALAQAVLSFMTGKRMTVWSPSRR